MISKPMLAHKFDINRVDYSQPVYIQPKLDGIRCLFTANGAFSRNKKQFMNLKHIEMALKPFFDQHPDVVLDGELYNHKLRNDFEKIVSLVRKQKPTEEDRRNAQHLIQFHCYDYIETVMDKPYSYRSDQLTCADFYDASIKYVETHLVNSKESAQLRHQYNLNNGYEGSILRLDKPYQQKRSYNLQKFKDFNDTEATIVGYEIGKGKREGTLGKFLMQDDDGIEFGCPPGKGYNYKDLANILNNIHDYIGKRATFTYFERTQYGSYRHPMFKTIRNYE